MIPKVASSPTIMNSDELFELGGVSFTFIFLFLKSIILSNVRECQRDQRKQMINDPVLHVVSLLLKRKKQEADK